MDAGRTGALDALRPSIDVAAALGDAPCYFVSGPAPSRMPSDHAFELLVDALAPVVSYARERGVTLAIETSSTSTRDLGFVHSLDDAVELSRRAEVGVCVELQNCWYDCHLRRMFREHVERFAIVQVNDFTVGDGARLNRRVPGDGDMPVEWLLGELLDAGYAGPFELEVVGPRIEEEGYPDAIERGTRVDLRAASALGSVTERRRRHAEVAANACSASTNVWHIVRRGTSSADTGVAMRSTVGPILSATVCRNGRSKL